MTGRRISDRMSDTGGEMYEECVASMQHAKEHPDENNATLAQLKRCRRSVPKLLSLHRTPVSRSGETAPSDEIAPGGAMP